MTDAKEDLSPCGRIVRENDPDRFFCTLFAPADRREALFALYAFNHELARVAEVVSEPMLGEIRLQWWRETLDGVAAQTPRRHEVAEGLAETWDMGFDRNLLEAMIDARSADLEAEPPEDLETLVEYGRATAGNLMFQACGILNGSLGPVDGMYADAGAAVTLSGLLRSTSSLRERGRVVLPSALLKEHRLDVRDVLSGENNSRLVAVIKEIGACAEHHAKAARKASRKVPKFLVPALLPLSFAIRDLATLKANGYNVFDPSMARRAGNRQFGVLWRAFLGRV
jgi:NADH dehydrogenase [ubiquinone] 1 alpha subcomplex assembly factor 6